MKRTCTQFLEACTDLLEQWVDGDAPKAETKNLLEEIYVRNVKKGTTKLPDPNLTARYETAKQLVIKGKRIGDACREAGITLDQWYRRKRIESKGKDRTEKREY